MLERWCGTARSGFVIRHNIAHGVSVKAGETLGYARNPRWHGELRKREFGAFWADEYTLDLVREALAVLLRVIMHLSHDDVSLKDVASASAMKAIKLASSVLGEFASETYNPSYEKY